MAATDLVDSTKDELQALEADLKLLAVSNRDLSHSNKTLTDTIAAISRAPIDPVVPRVESSPVHTPALRTKEASRDLHFRSLIAVPPVNLPPTIPRHPVPSVDMADHLQRCMKSVQELAQTIGCALDALNGHEKPGSSDIQGSYARLVAAMDQLPAHTQCYQCTRNVAWSDLEPERSGVNQPAACKCSSQMAPPLWKPCGSPTREVKGGHNDLKAQGPVMESSRTSVQSLDEGPQNQAGHEPNLTANLESIFPPLPHASSRPSHPSLAFSTRRRLPDHPFIAVEQKKATSPRFPTQLAVAHPEDVLPEARPRDRFDPRPKQGGRKRHSNLSKDSKDRSSKMRKKNPARLNSPPAADEPSMGNFPNGHNGHDNLTGAQQQLQKQVNPAPGDSLGCDIDLDAEFWSVGEFEDMPLDELDCLLAGQHSPSSIEIPLVSQDSSLQNAPSNGSLPLGDTGFNASSTAYDLPIDESMLSEVAIDFATEYTNSPVEAFKQISPEPSPDNVSAVQSLLERWIDANATAVLLGPGDG